MFERKWWKESVIYQIYPRSFKDSNSDGIGDIRGIIEKVDHFVSLGVNIIWLCPIFCSPNIDYGYDISDYRAISPEYGSIDDFKELLSLLHGKGIKLVLDIVLNHTSENHEWFIESRSSRQSPFRDYYIWRKGSDQKPPNNWASFFGDSAWQYDYLTDEFYLHIFSPSQPDLNWDNPRLRKEIHSILEKWLFLGVDGFRLDVINCIAKEKRFPDSDVKISDTLAWGGEYFMNQKASHDHVREMRRCVFSKYDCVLIGEAPGASLDDSIKYVSEDSEELDVLINFELMELDYSAGKFSDGKYDLNRFIEVTEKWQKTMHGKGWNSLYLSNHDQPRAVSRFGNDVAYRVESAKLLATYIFTLEGTPFIYQGDEIGMTNAGFNDISQYRDIESLNYYEKAVHDIPMSEAIRILKMKSRDNARTPFQWDSSLNAGFTDAIPWINLTENYKEINLYDDSKSHSSIFEYYRTLIKIRKENLVLIYGNFSLLVAPNPHVMFYMRSLECDCVYVLLNFSDELVTLNLPTELSDEKLNILISNYDINGFPAMDAVLRPWQVVVLKKESKVSPLS